MYDLGLEEIAQMFGEDITQMEQAADDAILSDDIGKPQVTHTEDVRSEGSLMHYSEGPTHQGTSFSHKA